MGLGALIAYTNISQVRPLYQHTKLMRTKKRKHYLRKNPCLTYNNPLKINNYKNIKYKKSFR